ncbi:MAG TPA: histidine kinase [Streptosporangiaceae bacterium]
MDLSTVDVTIQGRSVRAKPTGWLVSAGLAWSAAGAASVLAVLIAILAILGHDVSMVYVPNIAGFAGMGCLLLARRPGHPMGPLFCLISLASAIAVMPFAYVRYAVVHFPGSLPFAAEMLWATTWADAPALSLGLVLMLVFPEGRLLSRRWRPALWAALAFTPLELAGNAFLPRPVGDFFPNLPNPHAVYSAVPLFTALDILAFACYAFAATAAFATIIVRWKRADRVERLQMKWYIATLPLSAASWVTDIFTLAAPGREMALTMAFGSLAGGLMPVAIGVAVLRYRLYEIDVLLNRAVLYGSLTATVAAVYLAVVGTARGLFGAERSLAVQVLATVTAAMVLLPLRGRVQRRVDRLFYGDRGAPYDALVRLGRRVEDAADTGSALDSVARTVADSLRLPYVAVELRVGDGWIPAASYGEPPPQTVTFPLISQQESVGRLLVGTRVPGEQLGADDERLLTDLARHAGPAAHAVALRQALEASRAGLAATREEERRRLRRDLHDGLGPTLAGLTLGLDTALALAPAQPDLQDLLGRLKTETQRAVQDVRRIVYGLRPPTLDELGLAGSLREEITRLRSAAPGLAVTLDVPAGGLADLPAAVEVACYRITTEALTNVARHAHATRCLARIQLDHGTVVEVSDDGTGMPEGWRAGVGIASMRERVAELGGTLVIEPGFPRGTRVMALLPVAGQ